GPAEAPDRRREHGQQIEDSQYRHPHAGLTGRAVVEQHPAAPHRRRQAAAPHAHRLGSDRPRAGARRPQRIAPQAELIVNPAAAKQRTGGREALLQAAVEVIADKGVHAVTMRAVAEHADVSPGTVTYHFESADDLLVAALEFGAGNTARMLEELALDLQSTD